MPGATIQQPFRLKLKPNQARAVRHSSLKTAASSASPPSDLDQEEDPIIVISLTRIRPILNELQQQNNRNWIGLNIGPLPDDADIPSQEGLFVFAVAANSPAADTGLRPGDFVIRIGDAEIGDNDTDETLALYCRELRNYEDGDILPIAVQRGDETLVGEINGRPLQEPTTPTPTTQPSATLRPTNTPAQTTNTPVPPTNTSAPPTATTAPPTATSAPPTQPPPTQPPPTQPPPPTNPPPTQPPPPTNPPPTQPPPPTNTPEPP